MSGKIIPPETRPALILKKRDNCPYKCSDYINGLGYIDLCIYQPKDGYLRICKKGIPCDENPGCFPEDCPLEDVEDYQERMQHPAKREV